MRLWVELKVAGPHRKGTWGSDCQEVWWGSQSRSRDVTPAWKGNTEPGGLESSCSNAFWATSQPCAYWENKEFMLNFDEKTFCLTITWGSGRRWEDVLMDSASEFLTAVLVQQASLLTTSCRLVVIDVSQVLAASIFRDWIVKEVSSKVLRQGVTSQQTLIFNTDRC